MKAITQKVSVKLWLYLIIFLSITSCHENASSYKAEEVTLETVDVKDEYDAIEESSETANITSAAFTNTTHENSSLNIPANVKLIKTANTRYKVQDITKALTAIKKEMFLYGGYISELRLDKNYHEKNTRFTIKIPKENFDTMLDGIQKFAEETDYVNISTTDVTEKYTDAEARLQTKLEVKKRIENVLRTNAKSVKDILATENQLRVLQEEIEAVQGKLKYMSNRVAFSTIQVEIYETVTYKEQPATYQKGFGVKLKEGLLAGWEFVQGLVIALFYVWPLILLVTVGVIFFKRWRRARKA